MKDFISIDFETDNRHRVSACAFGFAKVSNYEIIETNGYLIKPVGGHEPFQSKIHGIKEEHTFDKAEFGQLFPEIKHIFDYPLAAHSLFDKQVLNALSDHFDLGLSFEYIDSSAIAREQFPNLKNHKLKTLVKYLGLPTFKHHDAREDAIACVNILLKLQDHAKEEIVPSLREEIAEFEGMAKGILVNDEVNYKEAYELLYWLEDHIEIAKHHHNLYFKTKEVLDDDYLDCIEAVEIKVFLEQALRDLGRLK